MFSLILGMVKSVFSFVGMNKWMKIFSGIVVCCTLLLSILLSFSYYYTLNKDYEIGSVTNCEIEFVKTLTGAK